MKNNSIDTVNTIMRNVVSGWTMYGLNIITTFFLTPFVIRSLGKPLYGVWVLIISLTTYYSYMRFGIPSTFKRYVPKFLAERKYNDLQTLVGTSSVVFLIMGLIAFFITIWMCIWGIKYFKISTEYLHITRIAFFIIGIDISLTFVFYVFNGLLWGLERFDLTNWVEVGKLITRVILIVGCLFLGYKLMSLAIIYFVTDMIGNFVTLYLCKRKCPFLRGAFIKVSGKMVRLIFGFGIYGFISNVAVQTVECVGPVLIGICLSITEIAYFSIPASLVKYGYSFLAVSTGVLMPTVSRLESGGDFQKIKEIFQKGSKYLFLFSLIMVSGLVILGKDFLTLWVGKDFGLYSTTVLHILAFSILTFPVTALGANIMFGTGRQKFAAGVHVFGCVSTIVLAIFLIKPLGIVGMAAAILLPKIVSGGIIYPVKLHRVIKISGIEFVRYMLIPVACVIPMMILLIGQRQFFPPHSFKILGIEVLISLIPTIWLGYKFCIGKEIKENLKLWKYVMKGISCGKGKSFIWKKGKNE